MSPVFEGAAAGVATGTLYNTGGPALPADLGLGAGGTTDCGIAGCGIATCGTGACAVMVAAALADGAARDTAYRVDVPGGTISVTWTADDRVLLTGPAEIVARGTTSL